MRCLLAFALSLALPAQPRAAESACAPVAFDGAGRAMDRLLAEIREAASSPGRAAPPIASVRAIRPIVVTVSGLEMGGISVGAVTLSDVLRISREMLPRRALEEESVRRRLAEWRSVVQGAGSGGAGRAANYVELRLREAAQAHALDVEIVNFHWSRAALDTGRTVSEFERRLLALRDDALTRGRPLHIVAHSWGGVLIYEALTRLERSGRAVDVQTFVSLGSPLVPRKVFVEAFKGIYDLRQHLRHRVVKPRGVRVWVNLWAELDPYSSPIPAADENIRVDTRAVPYLERLRALSTARPAAVRRDIAALRNPGDWHFSYLLGFRATLRTLRERVWWDIFEDNLRRILPACAPLPAPSAPRRGKAAAF